MPVINIGNGGCCDCFCGCFQGCCPCYPETLVFTANEIIDMSNSHAQGGRSLQYSPDQGVTHPCGCTPIDVADPESLCVNFDGSKWSFELTRDDGDMCKTSLHGIDYTECVDESDGNKNQSWGFEGTIGGDCPPGDVGPNAPGHGAEWTEAVFDAGHRSAVCGGYCMKVALCCCRDTNNCIDKPNPQDHDQWACSTSCFRYAAAPYLCHLCDERVVTDIVIGNGPPDGPCFQAYGAFGTCRDNDDCEEGYRCLEDKDIRNQVGPWGCTKNLYCIKEEIFNGVQTFASACTERVNNDNYIGETLRTYGPAGGLNMPFHTRLGRGGAANVTCGQWSADGGTSNVSFTPQDFPAKATCNPFSLPVILEIRGSFGTDLLLGLFKPPRRGPPWGVEGSAVGMDNYTMVRVKGIITEA